MTPLPDTPLVSVVTPSYNTGRFIEETLLSVAQQDYPRVEHIVLDSGSADETLGILARYPSVRLVSPAPQGVSAKINLGFSVARGDIVVWVNADDFLLPGAIRKAVEALTRNPQAAMAYSNLLEVDEHSAETRRARTKQASWREMLAHNYVPLESAFMRHEALERIGPIDTRYPLVQDWDMILRIYKQFPVVHVDDWWSAFRIRQAQRSNLYRYQIWVQSREMTREHGGTLMPLLWSYWGTKLARAGRMLRSGQFGRLKTKLGNHVVSFRGHYGLGRHESLRGDTRNRLDY